MKNPPLHLGSTFSYSIQEETGQGGYLPKIAQQSLFSVVTQIYPNLSDSATWAIHSNRMLICLTSPTDTSVEVWIIAPSLCVFGGDTGMAEVTSQCSHWSSRVMWKMDSKAWCFTWEILSLFTVADRDLISIQIMTGQRKILLFSGTRTRSIGDVVPLHPVSWRCIPQVWILGPEQTNHHLCPMPLSQVPLNKDVSWCGQQGVAK